MRIPSDDRRGTSADYLQRINRALDHVLQHLDGPLPLADVAAIACFSPHHFHRVFRALVGETLLQFVKRCRLERALTLMSRPSPPPLIEVAMACGFASPSDFSRAFKQRYGTAPSAFDLEAFRRDRREEWQNAVADPGHRHLLDRLPPGANPDGFVADVRLLPRRRVAYIRVLNSFQAGLVPAAIGRLVAWAEARGIADGQWLGYMWDDPELVAPEQCRYDVGLVVEDDVMVGGEVGALTFPAMTVAHVEVRGPIDVEVRAIEWLYRTWLPSSGYVPAEHPAFESWIGRPLAHGMTHFEIDAQLPIEPARG
ncbi:MAG: AraC family transcriptional regulator [Planctomycetota bacterium]